MHLVTTLLSEEKKPMNVKKCGRTPPLPWKCPVCSADILSKLCGVTRRSGRDVPDVTGRQKGVFVKEWFWRTCPRCGFRSRGTCERTLVPVFVSGEHANVTSFRFLVPGNIRQNRPFGNHPFPNPEDVPGTRPQTVSPREISSSLSEIFRGPLGDLLGLCWVRAASGPFFGEQFISA